MKRIDSYYGRAMTKRERRDRDVVSAAFSAISAAMGWDKEYPKELYAAVAARMRIEAPEVISKFDADLKERLHPEEEESEIR